MKKLEITVILGKFEPKDIFDGSIEQVKAKLAGIKNHALVLKDMPKKGPLSAEQQDLLTKWIDAGAPELCVIGGAEIFRLRR